MATPDETERDKAAMGPTQAATATRERQQIGCFVVVSLLSSFLYLTLLLFRQAQ